MPHHPIVPPAPQRWPAPWRVLAIAALLLPVAVAPVAAQQVVRSATSVSQTAGNPSGGGAAELNALINQIGLEERTTICQGAIQCNSAAFGGSPLQYTSGVTLWDTYFSADPSHTTERSKLQVPEVYHEWYSGTWTSSATLRFDFGAPIWLSGIAIWNEDAVGVGAFALKDGSGNTLLASQPLTDNVSWPTSNPYRSDRFAFTAVETQYLTLELESCGYWNATFGNVCSLGEVAFRQELSSSPPSPTPVPEPASMTLVAAGLVGMGVGALRRRRRQLA